LLFVPGVHKQKIGEPYEEVEAMAGRNTIVGTSLEGRLLIVSFNTTVPLEKEWLPVGTQIIQSIEVKWHRQIGRIGGRLLFS
jgi:hypothetical protein